MPPKPSSLVPEGVPGANYPSTDEPALHSMQEGQLGPSSAHPSHPDASPTAALAERIRALEGERDPAEEPKKKKEKRQQVEVVPVEESAEEGPPEERAPKNTEEIEARVRSQVMAELEAKVSKPVPAESQGVS